MRKRRMIVIVNENYEVSTKFHGSTEELSRCNKALARHIKEQARVSSILANAANFTEDRAPSVTVSKEQYEQKMKGATK